MSNLKILNKDGQLVVSSRQIAEDFEKRNSHVVEAVENKIKSLTTENSEVEISKLFIPSTFNHNGNEYKEYLLTRDGFTFIVMGFTGAKADAWKLKYIEAFNKMEQTLKSGQPKPLSAMDQLRLQYQVIETHEERLEKLENNMVIAYGQEVTIKKQVDIQVKKMCFGSESPAYLDKTLRSRIYKALWRDYKDYFNITSYHNTLQKDFDKALDVVKAWKPVGGLLREIQTINSQISI